jgi:hypothetical protein
MIRPEPLVTKRRTASVSEAQELAAEWAPGVLECRAYGHQWRPSRVIYNKVDRFYAIYQTCPRCEKAERYQEMTTTGRVVASYIHYEPGYLAVGVGPIVGEAKDAVRVAAVVRVYQVEQPTAAVARAEHAPRSLAMRRVLGLVDEGSK